MAEAMTGVPETCRVNVICMDRKTGSAVTADLVRKTENADVTCTVRKRCRRMSAAGMDRMTAPEDRVRTGDRWPVNISWKS